MAYLLAIVSAAAFIFAARLALGMIRERREADERAARIARKWATRPSSWRDGFGSASHHDRAGEN